MFSSLLAEVFKKLIRALNNKVLNLENRLNDKALSRDTRCNIKSIFNNPLYAMIEKQSLFLMALQQDYAGSSGFADCIYKEAASFYSFLICEQTR